MNNTVIIKTKVSSSEIAIIAEFLQWMQRYIDSIYESYLNPDMDDEIIIISCEGYIQEHYESMSDDTKCIALELIDQIFQNHTEVRSQMFIYHLSKIGQLAEAA